MWKGLLSPTFSSSETAAAAAAELTVGSVERNKKKRRRRNSCTRDRETCATDLFMDSPQLLYERKAGRSHSTCEKTDFPWQINHHCHGYLRRHVRKAYMCLF